ncbi:TonB-dependent receptor [Bacteroides sp. 1001136B_160425_E2]|uniref:TonB-dependent receptor n=1 Tax=Bacteroides sp. 1001136B_160425_E2 TaxID=2787083 RepID=UPI001E5F8A26|nr:TonB-dependent receptor [Bacteroides sp. 1001136B_160425_E2]
MAIAYNDSKFPKEKISVDIENQPLEQALNNILQKTGFTYIIKDDYIMIIPKKNVKDSKDKKITGQVIDSRGEPLVGVNVKVKGKSVGAITDMDGNFSLQVKETDILDISYIGYAAQEVEIGNNTNLSIVMSEDNQLLNEVVVTALGIKRETKSLTYNVQEMKSTDLTAVKDANFVNSLSGKIAGVTINQSASGIGGSTRVVMRGTKSLFGDNNALYVLDGIPLSSMKTDQTESFYENPDGGDSDGISNLNPDDIESVSVLTGAAAAALYGTQGANGVILITTKKGEEGKIKVNYSNDTQFMTPFVKPKFQNTYGSEEGQFSSWGNKLETPSTYDPFDYLQTGFTETNSLSVSTGTDRNQTYISAAATNARGIIPNNEYNRYNFTVRNTAELIKDKLTFDFSASYVKSYSQNMMSQGQYHNPLIPLYLFPRGDDIEKYKLYERYNPERGFKTQYWEYGVQDLSMQNPFWIMNRERFENVKDRYIFSGTLRYRIIDGLNVTGRLRMDNAGDTYERKLSASTDLLFASDKGNYMHQKTDYKNVYGDIIANFDRKFGNFGVNINLGGNFSTAKKEVNGYEGHLQTVPNLFIFANIIKGAADTHAIQSGYEENNQAVFGTAQLSYKSGIFLDVTGRNDWYSSLAFTSHEKKGFFYPSVGLSAVMTEFFDLSKAKISFLKLRASYSAVGNAPQRFVTNTTYNINEGVLETLPNVPATFLKPERTKSFETGINLRLFDGKLSVDATYYNSNTYNQFFTFTMPPSSGYKEFYLNGGKVNNWGIEASLVYKQALGPVNWRSGITFTMNRNKIKELLPDDAVNPLTGEKLQVTEIEPFQPQGSYKMILKEGGTMNDIYVSGLRTDEKGYIYMDPATGAISEDSNNWIKAGSAAPRFNWGFNNSFEWKGVNLSFLITARVGGVGVSATQAIMDRYGVSEASAIARDNGGVPLNGNNPIDARDYYEVVGKGNTGILSQYVYSATNVRLQELSLGYTFPKKWLGNVVDKLTLSVIGKNLFMFYNKAPFDPELSASTSTYYQGFDYFMQPSLRSIGFSLKVGF